MIAQNQQPFQPTDHLVGKSLPDKTDDLPMDSFNDLPESTTFSEHEQPLTEPSSILLNEASAPAPPSSSPSFRQRLWADCKHITTIQLMICVSLSTIMILLNTFYPVVYHDISTQMSHQLRLKDGLTHRIQPTLDSLSNATAQYLFSSVDPSTNTDSVASTSSSEFSPSSISKKNGETLAELELLSQQLASKLEQTKKKPDKSTTSKSKTSPPPAGGTPTITDSIPANASLEIIKYKNKLDFPLQKQAVITSAYGVRTHPITKNKDFHTGVDFSASEGTPIIAPQNGTILYAGKGESLGNFIRLKHPDGVVTVYGHCKDLYVKEGQQIKKGDIIASVGNTGMSTGAHLHLAVMLHGKYINPAYVFHHVPI